MVSTSSVTVSHIFSNSEDVHMMRHIISNSLTGLNLSVSCGG